MWLYVLGIRSKVDYCWHNVEAYNLGILELVWKFHREPILGMDPRAIQGLWGLSTKRCFLANLYLQRHKGMSANVTVTSAGNAKLVQALTLHLKPSTPERSSKLQEQLSSF